MRNTTQIKSFFLIILMMLGAFNTILLTTREPASASPATNPLILRPDGQKLTGSDGWTSSPNVGTNHYQNVDETTSDANTTYIQCASTGVSTNYSIWTLANAGTQSVTINNVISYYYLLSPNYDNGLDDVELLCGNWSINMANNWTEPTTTGYTLYTAIFPTNPVDGSPWNWSAVDKLQLGLSARMSAGHSVRCTQAWIEVYWSTVAPTVTTNTATGVEETNATLHGTLTNDGGEASWCRFQYGTTTSYTGSFYIYAGGVTTNKVYQYWNSNMSKRAESISLSGSIFCVMEDTHYVYASTGSGVYQFYKNNMTFKYKFSGIISYSMAQDDTYLYFSRSGGDQDVQQYWKSNLTAKADTIMYGGSIKAIMVDSTYLYVGGDTVGQATIYFKSNMTKKTDTIDFGSTIYSMIQDENYFYLGGNNGKLYQYYKSNMTKKTGITLGTGAGQVFGLAQDALYIYGSTVATGTTFRVQQYYKNNMTKKAETVNYGDTILTVHADGIYVYVGGWTTNKVYQYWSSNMTKKAESASYGGTINFISSTTNYYYSTGNTLSHNIIGLTPGTVYHYRTIATNTNGTGYGSDKTFLTKPQAPTALSITNTASGQQTLTWTHGTGYNRSVVRGTIGSYPATPTSGTAVYNNTGTTAVHTGLTGGDDWYYRAWEYANESGLHQYSDSYTQGNLLAVTTPVVTTNNATGVEETNATLHGTLTDDGGENCNVSFNLGLTTSYGTTLIPPKKTYDLFLRPNGVGDATQHSSTLATNWEAVDETSSNDSDYVYLNWNSGWKYDLYSLQNHSTENGTINYITIYSRVKRTATAATFSCKQYLKANGVEYQSSSSPITVAWSYLSATWNKNPNTNLNWTWNEIDALQTGPGLYRTAVGILTQCSQHYIVVNYTKDFYNTVDTFSYNATGLTPGKLYHHRATATNSIGQGNGTDKTFLTKPQAPTGLTATDINTNHTQRLTWTTGTGHNRSVVRVSTTGFPATPSSGTSVYNNTGNIAYYSTPLPGQAYFYRAWEYANESGLHQFSDTYSEAKCLTKPNNPMNFILNWTYDPLVPFGISPYQINITWTKGTGANLTVIIRKTNSYPTSVTDGTVVYNGTGTNKLNTNLSLYTHHYYRVWSYTTWSGLNQYSNTGVNITLVETSNVSTSLTTATTTRLYGYLITQPGTHQYRFSYGQGSYSTNTTNLYRNTTGVIQRNITGLTPGKLYQYRAYANDSNGNRTYGNKKYFLTRPYAPTNVNYNIFNSSAVNLTWTKGTGSNRTVIVMNHLHNPTNITDGTVVYNGTASYHHLSITPGTPYYCRAYGLATWTYNPTLWMYSGNGTNMTWTYLGANCFNESKPTQALTFNIQFKDEYGQHTFTAIGVTNTYILNISQIPIGTDILIKVWATGYKERLMTIAVTPSTYYNLTFYLPPISSTTNTTGGDTSNCVTRSFTNSINISNPAVDATITFSHKLDEMIQVERYNSSVDRTLRSYTDSKTITSKTNDVWIPLNHTKESIISVQVWNTTLYGTYGGWFPVPADKYTYITGNNTIRINKTILNTNALTITQAKADYYYWGGGTYGAWQFVTETKYTYNTTKLIVNKTALDSFTTMLRVTYYWQDCPGETTKTPLYYCRVVETIRTEFSEFDRPVENAQVWFQTYISTTGKYVNVSVLQTDGNGYITIYLLPSNLYQVIIRKTGFNNYRSDYIPAPANQYGQTTEKLFRIVRSGSTIPTINYTYLMQNITWSLEPLTLKRQGPITFTFTINSTDNKLEWYNMTITFYNKTQRKWIQIFTQNDTNAGGGTITFTTPNVTGDYDVEIWFKKTGYPQYQLFQTGSLRYTIIYIQAWIRAIPDFVWYLILVVIMIIIMGFCFTVLGTGLITGYIGLGVMAFGLLLKPDLTVNGFSGWVIWTITFLIYTMGLFIWSRI